MRQPPSTTSWASEKRHPTAEREPGPDRLGDAPDRHRRRVHLLPGEQRPAVRADLPAQGRDAERRQAREGQRGARGRLPRRDRQGHHRASGRRSTARSARSPCSTSSSTRRSSRCRWTRRSSVRPRSALGLKYVELIPGRSKKTFQDGDTIPLSRATPNAPELEDVLSTFPPRTRDDARKSLEGFGDSIAGRGEAINTTIRELEPFTRYLLPVMRNLSSRKTELKGFFPGLGAAAAEVAPVAKVQAELLVEHGRPPSPRSRATPRRSARRSRRARRRCRRRPSRSACRRRSWRASPPCRATSSRARRCCPTTLPLINGALSAGVPAFRETPELGERPRGPVPGRRAPRRQPEHAARAQGPPPGGARDEAGDPVRRPVPDGLQLLRLLLQPARHAPVVGRCPGGAASASSPSWSTPQQQNSLGSTESKYPVDVPSDQDPQAEPAKQALHTQYGGPAIDSQGPRRLPGAARPAIPNRLVTEPALPAGQLGRQLPAAAAATWSWTRTRPGWRAAPTSRASSGSRA